MALYYFRHLQLFDLVNPKSAIICVYLQKKKKEREKNKHTCTQGRGENNFPKLTRLKILILSLKKYHFGLFMIDP